MKQIQATFWKSLMNPNAPGGVVDMYLMADVETGEGCFSFGAPHGDRATPERIVKAWNLYERMAATIAAQHDAIDVLLAQLIEKDKTFLPTKSPVWPACVLGAETLKEIRL